MVEGQREARQAVYVVVNEGGHTTDSIRKVRAVFIDADVYAGKGSPLDETVWHQVPSFIVVRDPAISWQAVLARGRAFPAGSIHNHSAEACGALRQRPSVADLPRVMRVPGFLHQKNEKCPQEFALVDPLNYAKEGHRGRLLKPAGLVYSHAEIGAGLSELPWPSRVGKHPPQVTAAGTRALSIAEAEHHLSFINPEFKDDYPGWAGRARALRSDPQATPLIGENGDALLEGDIERDLLLDEWCSGELWRARTKTPISSWRPIAGSSTLPPKSRAKRVVLVPKSPGEPSSTMLSRTRTGFAMVKMNVLSSTLERRLTR